MQSRHSTSSIANDAFSCLASIRRIAGCILEVGGNSRRVPASVVYRSLLFNFLLILLTTCSVKAQRGGLAHSGPNGIYVDLGTTVLPSNESGKPFNSIALNAGRKQQRTGHRLLTCLGREHNLKWTWR